MNIRYDRHSLIINETREIIRSGAMHYFRLPSQDLWYDRLFKLKAAGYNTVDLYFCWAYHSTKQGEYNFNGIRDVRRLLAMTQELGLHVIARPGPYINAEYSGGGFPGWLLAKRHLPLRNRKAGAFVWSPEYMEAVQEWWQTIIPIINDSPNVILVQIENEYGTLEVEPDYIQALYTMTRDLGVTVPLFHNDLYVAGLYEDIVDIYSFDNYSVTQFETDWRDRPEVFQVIDQVEETLRPFCQNRPLMVAELQAGWFGSWKGYSYQTMISLLGREHISIATKSLLGQGLTVFNHYKAVGGTNWDYTGSIETYTSYDFAAPIAEVGLNTIRLFEAKAINLFLSSFDLTRTDRAELPGLTLSDSACLYAIRQVTDVPDAYWVFLRNLTHFPETLTMQWLQKNGEDTTVEVTINPFEVLILPVGIQLLCGYSVCLASTEFLYQNQSTLYLKGNRSFDLVLLTEQGEEHRLSIDALVPQGIRQIQVNQLSVVVLGQNWIDTFWLEENGDVVLGPEMRLPNGVYGFYPETTQYICHRHAEGDTGTVIPQSIRDAAVPATIPDMPDMKVWQFFNETPELRADFPFHLSFQPVAAEGMDFDVNGFYEGEAWYHVTLAQPVKTLTLDARHVWAVFVNGDCVRHDSHLALIPGIPAPDPVEIDLGQAKWFMEKDQTNSLVIFVSGLGHPKGFHDDAQTPQGLISLLLDGVPANPNVRFRKGLVSQSSDYDALPKTMLSFTPSGHIVRMQSHFTLPSADNRLVPWGIELGALDIERINIYLNNVLVGRYWQECQQQTLFYLPPGILKEDASNKLDIVLMNFPAPVKAEMLETLTQKIMLKPYQTLSLASIPCSVSVV
jgi:hypothetical protein